MTYPHDSSGESDVQRPGRPTPSRWRPAWAVAGMLAVAGVVLAGCGGSGSSSASAATSGDCPVAPIDVVVSVDQWGDIVDQLAGACGSVKTIITSSAIDPHDYEPTTGNIAAFNGAKMVVVNGAGYDDWAIKAAAASSSSPAMVNAAEVVGVKTGANPHIWYGPDFVSQTAAAVTAELKTLMPQAAAYLDSQQEAWKVSMRPYFDEVARVKKGATGKTYGATEEVFDYMAAAVGMVNETPTGYMTATANESDPSPGDIAAFESALKSKQMNVLVFNTQTEGAIPAQIQQTATGAGVPVVNVTETVAQGATSFEQWQVSQLQELAKALGISG